MGQKIENTILEILELTLSASHTSIYKNDILRKANNKIDLLKYLFRLAYETESIKMNNYLIFEEEVIEISKMIGGWRRFLK